MYLQMTRNTTCTASIGVGTAHTSLQRTRVRSPVNRGTDVSLTLVFCKHDGCS